MPSCTTWVGAKGPGRRHMAVILPAPPLRTTASFPPPATLPHATPLPAGISPTFLSAPHLCQQVLPLHEFRPAHTFASRYRTGCPTAHTVQLDSLPDAVPPSFSSQTPA
eukprot:358302-Chlamydomonas_euryale.AAC.11